MASLRPLLPLDGTHTPHNTIHEDEVGDNTDDAVESDRIRIVTDRDSNVVVSNQFLDYYY